MRGDKRIWAPDETCDPFRFDNLTAAVAGQALFRFRVPSRHLAVITTIVVAYPSAEKSTFTIRFRRGRSGANDLAGMPITGALQSVEEISGPLNTRQDGLGPQVASGIGTDRIVLEEGEWEIFPTAAATIGRSQFAGWIFPLHSNY